jgi:hypothetical protein
LELGPAQAQLLAGVDFALAVAQVLQGIRFGRLPPVVEGPGGQQQAVVGAQRGVGRDAVAAAQLRRQRVGLNALHRAAQVVFGAVAADAHPALHREGCIFQESLLAGGLGHDALHRARPQGGAGAQHAQHQRRRRRPIGKQDGRRIEPIGQAIVAKPVAGVGSHAAQHRQAHLRQRVEGVAGAQAALVAQAGQPQAGAGGVGAALVVVQLLAQLPVVGLVEADDVGYVAAVVLTHEGRRPPRVVNPVAAQAVADLLVAQAEVAAQAGGLHVGAHAHPPGPGGQQQGGVGPGRVQPAEHRAKGRGPDYHLGPARQLRQQQQR